MAASFHEPELINPASIIDGAPIGALQVRTVLLCGLVALVDGLDVQTMAILTPSVAADWKIAPSAFGPVLAAGFAGVMTGTPLLGMAGDRFGRRPTIIIAFLLLGVLSLLTALASSVDQLLMARFLTGFAIGGCLPNAAALAAEYMPTRRAGLSVTLIGGAIPLGGVIGSLLASGMIDALGWRGVFVLGGTLPVMIALLLIAALPESVSFLARRGNQETRIAKILTMIDPGFGMMPACHFVESRAGVRTRVDDLFRDGRARTTLTPWISCFFSLAVVYLFSSWLPSILVAAGWPLASTIRSLAAFQTGGIVGGVLAGWLLDRLPAARVLMVTFGIALLATLLLGSGQNRIVSVLLIALVGAGAVGGQICLMAAAAITYPTAMRASGVGWTLGIGRLGAVLSPLVGGALLHAGWSNNQLFS